MKKKDLIFIAIIVGVVGIFIFLSAIGRKPPLFTDRPEHAGLNSKTQRDTCLVCHAPDATVAPMSARHPKKGKPNDRDPDKWVCFKCHKEEKPLTATILSGIAEVKLQWPSQHQK
jgi:hypothetical protein